MVDWNLQVLNRQGTSEVKAVQAQGTQTVLVGAVSIVRQR